MLAIMDFTSGGTARPFASSSGADGGNAREPQSLAPALRALPFMKGIGSFASSLRYSSGLTANINAINMQTIVTKRLSVVRKLFESKAFKTASATNANATITHIRLSRVASRFINPVSLIAIEDAHLLQQLTLSLMLGLSCRRCSLRHFLVTTSFTLPNRVSSARICSALVDSAVRRNDLATAARADTTARGSFFNINAGKTFFSHLINSKET